MIWENWVPFKKNKREALIKKMVLKRLGDEIRPISYQKFVFSCQNDVLVDQNDILLDQNDGLVDQNVVLVWYCPHSLSPPPPRCRTKGCLLIGQFPPSSALEPPTPLPIFPSSVLPAPKGGRGSGGAPLFFRHPP